MKDLKEFDTKKELNAAIKAVEGVGIQCDSTGNVLQVHISHFIKARDAILDMEDRQRRESNA